MKNFSRFAAVTLFLAILSGCGDNPNLMVHDLLVFWNEVGDNMLRATDEPTAKQLVNVQFKLLKTRHETIKDRIDKAFKAYDKEDFKDLDNALVDYKIEIEATTKRLDECQKRLDGIIASTLDSSSLKEIRNWPDTKRQFDKISLRSYAPKADIYLHPVKNSDFGKGLVPMRPQLDLAKKGEPEPPPAPK